MVSLVSLFLYIIICPFFGMQSSVCCDFTSWFVCWLVGCANLGCAMKGPWMWQCALCCGHDGSVVLLSLVSYCFLM